MSRLLCVLPLIALFACADEAPQVDCRPTATTEFCPSTEDVAAYVRPMVGTAGPGNVVPGALVPHGMVKLSPDTNAGSGSVDGYEYNDDEIEGFSHTHLQGPGGGSNGYSQVLLMPFTGPAMYEEQDYGSKYQHDSETAAPGYYAVTLDDYGVRAELTATGHAGLHRYTFTSTQTPSVLLDVGHTRGGSRDGEVQIEGRVLKGFGEYSVHPLLTILLESAPGITGKSTIYFYIQFDQDIQSFGVWDKDGASEGIRSMQGPKIGAWVRFADSVRVVEARVGISMISVELAERNLREEVGESSFDEVKDAARSAWNCALGRVSLETDDETAKELFYTGLFHTLFAPADYTEAGGAFFSGADGIGAVHTADHKYYTDDWCAWDTFRTSRPLAMLVEPETIRDVMQSYLHIYETGGWLPKCTWNATGYSRVMIGNHGASIVADAVNRGFLCEDTELAWQAVYKTSMKDTRDWLLPEVCGYFNLGTPPEYVRNGYVSHECDVTQSASMTLEYAYNDWTVALMADKLGRTEDKEIFMARSQNYRHHWNPDSGFMEGKKEDGRWVSGFDPEADHDANDFAEATSWIYTWFVPQDVPGLIEIMGGNQAFVTKLDQYFNGGHHDHANEPGFHTPYLFNYAGAAAKTQEKVRSLLAEEFSTQPNGLPGNDDAGATSAWFVLSALGIYPVAPGDGRYQLSTPLFEKATMHLHPEVYEGGSFVIEAPGVSDSNIYIQAVTLNGEALTRTWISHDEIVAGGVLRLEMGATPSSWPSP